MLRRRGLHVIEAGQVNLAAVAATRKWVCVCVRLHGDVAGRRSLGHGWDEEDRELSSSRRQQTAQVSTPPSPPPHLHWTVPPPPDRPELFSTRDLMGLENENRNRLAGREWGQDSEPPDAQAHFPKCDELAAGLLFCRVAEGHGQAAASVLLAIQQGRSCRFLPMLEPTALAAAPLTGPSRATANIICSSRLCSNQQGAGLKIILQLPRNYIVIRQWAR
jgi:hypothetical protein